MAQDEMRIFSTINPGSYAGAHFATFPPALVEPMLEAVNVSNWTGGWLEGRLGGYDEAGRYVESELYREFVPAPYPLDWFVCGAESGSGARWMDPDWARDLRDQCHAAGVAFYMKQMSNRAPIPEDLMVREYPA